MSLAILFHFLCAQHVSDINISIIRRLHIRNVRNKLLMMDISMSETCWAHKKWNKMESGIKLVFYSSNITMMHGPINIRFISSCSRLLVLSLPLPVPWGDGDVCCTPGGRNKWLSPRTRRFPQMWELYTSSDHQLNSEHHLTNCDHLMCYSYDTSV